MWRDYHTYHTATYTQLSVPFIACQVGLSSSTRVSVMGLRSMCDVSVLAQLLPIFCWSFQPQQRPAEHPPSPTPNPTPNLRRGSDCWRLWTTCSPTKCFISTGSTTTGSYRNRHGHPHVPISGTPVHWLVGGPATGQQPRPRLWRKCGHVSLMTCSSLMWTDDLSRPFL